MNHMRSRTSGKRIAAIGLLAGLLCLSACPGAVSGHASDAAAGSSTASSKLFEVSGNYIVSDAEGLVANEDGSAAVGLSGVPDGFVTVTYSGNAEGARVSLTGPDGLTAPLPLTPGKEAVLSLSAGSGSYRISVSELTQHQDYALILSVPFEASLNDEDAPYLNPSSFVRFSADSSFAAGTAELLEASSGDPEVFTALVYDFITLNIAYDEELVGELSIDYIPDADRTFTARKGLCFDYASLMAAMLRSGGVPARVVVGYFGAYMHAWTEAAPNGSANGWTAYDPTLGACNPPSEVSKVLGGSSYIVKYRF